MTGRTIDTGGNRPWRGSRGVFTRSDWKNVVCWRAISCRWGTFSPGRADIPSTDVAGLAYHPSSGRLYLADSEINELSSPTYQGNNIFVSSLDGQLVDARASDNTEPTGITYNSFDDFFYVTNDDKRTITKYDATFDTPLLTVDTTGVNAPEGITSDPSGFLYVADGRDGDNQVIVYDTAGGGISLVRSFSVAAHVGDAEGIAYDAATNHLFIVSSPDDAIFEFILNGDFVERYDVGGFIGSDGSTRPDNPQGLTFAPTSRPDLYPGRWLFISPMAWKTIIPTARYLRRSSMAADRSRTVRQP